MKEGDNSLNSRLDNKSGNGKINKNFTNEIMIESKDNPNEKDISLIGNIFINNNKKNYILMEKKN